MTRTVFALLLGAVLMTGAMIGTGLALVNASGLPERIMAMIPTPTPPPCRMADGQPVAFDRTPVTR